MLSPSPFSFAAGGAWPDVRPPPSPYARRGGTGTGSWRAGPRRRQPPPGWPCWRGRTFARPGRDLGIWKVNDLTKLYLTLDSSKEMIWPDSIWIINENEVIIMIPWVGIIRLTGYNFVWVRNVCINFGIIEIRRGDRILSGVGS